MLSRSCHKTVIFLGQNVDKNFVTPGKKPNKINGAILEQVGAPPVPSAVI
jgi:hypothetical protein